MGLPDRLPNQTCLARVQSESQCLGRDLGQFYKKGHHTRLKRYYKGLRSLRGCAGAPGALGKAGTEEPESSQARSPTLLPFLRPSRSSPFSYSPLPKASVPNPTPF